MSKPHVLVVDDRVNMLHLLEKVLREDVVVHTAGSGAAAIEVLQSQPVQAVVCDLRLPDMTGIDVLRASKRMQPNAQVVLMTAYASVPTAVEAMREGAYDYITKPFEPGNLRAIVLRALGREFVPNPVDGDEAGLPETSESVAVGAAAADFASASSAEPESLLSKKWHEAIELGRKEVARQYLQAVLKKYGGRVSDAAVHAGVERESFYRLLRRYGVQPGDVTDPEE